jgi:hypothetical protein
LAFAIAMMAGPANAQTIGELAEAQRAKLRQELAMKNAPAAVAPPKETQVVSIAPVVAEPPKLRVHALYRRGVGDWVAEITNGFQLVKPVPGMVYGKYMLETVDGEGLHLKRVGNCARKKNCESKRLVRLGGEL